MNLQNDGLAQIAPANKGRCLLKSQRGMQIIPHFPMNGFPSVGSYQDFDGTGTTVTRLGDPGYPEQL